MVVQPTELCPPEKLNLVNGIQQVRLTSRLALRAPRSARSVRSGQRIADRRCAAAAALRGCSLPWSKGNV